MTNQLPPRAVVFDLDGLLFNTEQIYPLVAQELLARRGKDFPRELHLQMMGRPARVSLKNMIDYHHLEDSVETLAAESAEIFLAHLDTSLAPMPGALELLDCLEEAKLPKALATSSSRAFAEDILGRFDLIPRFEFLLCAEDVIQGKPHPEIYLTASNRLGVMPREMMVLEDSQNGFRAALAAGTITVAVPGEHNADQTYEGADLILETLADAILYERIGLAPPMV